MTDLPTSTLQAAAAGDQDAWRRLVAAYSGRVYGLIARQCGDGELAEEITQATFVTVVGKLAEYVEQGRFEAWLFRIALNRLRDEMRRRKRQATATDFAELPPEAVGGQAMPRRSDSPTAEQHLLDKERADLLHQAMAKLNEADREVLHMRYTADLGYQQIAEALDQPLGTVLARGHRALKKLRALLAKDEEPET
jgi:RNA polymerase sigma-70 factor (ECF subfamily)